MKHFSVFQFPNSIEKKKIKVALHQIAQKNFFQCNNSDAMISVWVFSKDKILNLVLNESNAHWALLRGFSGEIIPDLYHLKTNINSY